MSASRTGQDDQYVKLPATDMIEPAVLAAAERQGEARE
uniref:Uncharacterized protein n=1 Tax=Raoultella ornithinolytica TaxID=54291 RepID=A0A4D6FZ65_RAOOR|nr:hypothetical protein [Raoultella ornithinolytica]